MHAAWRWGGTAVYVAANGEEVAGFGAGGAQRDMAGRAVGVGECTRRGGGAGRRCTWRPTGRRLRCLARAERKGTWLVGQWTLENARGVAVGRDGGVRGGQRGGGCGVWRGRSAKGHGW